MIFPQVSTEAEDQEMSVLSQGLTPPDQIPVATDQLPAPKEKLELLPSTSGPLHQFVLPPNLEGQAPVLRPGRRPAAATREHPITPTPTAPGTAQPTSAPSGVLCPQPRQHAVTGAERNRRRRALEEEGGVAKRRYVRGVAYNTCGKCGQPKTKDFGHSRYGSATFCPQASEGKSLEEWLEEQRPLK
ncbi:hypothetical protein D5F01_LYC23994 [Larimichthys crocea]|uniref:Uncharacterized protein n=1 Tax=Larimichthys crocea TaxID=215358 RepID=A0A6G0HFE1_LARCR|nr:hypothetical protein D5F01_LYC23994 [Larimichthys crocea]